MTVVVKRGILRPGRVIVDGRRWRVRRDMESFVVEGANAMDAGRVRYFDWRDHMVLERPEGQVDVVFHPEETTFRHDGRTFRVAPMALGLIHISEGGRDVVTGRVTPGGVRLDFVGPDLRWIQRELAFGLALRSEALRKEWHFRGPSGEHNIPPHVYR